MDQHLNLDREKILNEKFTPNVKGYDPQEVDRFLDLAMQDYGVFQRYMKESKSYIEELELSLSKLKDQNHKYELENGKMKKRLAGIKDTDNVNSSNLEYIQRIRQLENALYQHGIDPSKIK